MKTLFEDGRMYGRKEIMKTLNISDRTFHGLVNHGKLPRMKLKTRHVYFGEGLNRFVKENSS